MYSSGLFLELYVTSLEPQIQQYIFGRVAGNTTGLEKEKIAWVHE